MNTEIRKKMSLAIAVLALCTVLLGTQTWGQAVSNLNNVLVYNRNYAGDHSNTPEWCNLIKTIGETNGFNVDITNDPIYFSVTSLAKYDVILLFNAYVFGTGMSLEQKENVQAFYEENRGLGCIHQCVRHDGWQWYQKVMTVRYTTWASVSTGTVTVDDEAAYTEPVAGYEGKKYTWHDEWYNYAEDPRGMEGVTMVWSLNGDEVEGATGGPTHPLAWMHSNHGGRFLLNGAFHTSDLLTVAPEFTRAHLLGTLKFLAGYTGCGDDAYAEYDANVTHHDEEACVNLAGVGCMDVKYQEYDPLATIHDESYCLTLDVNIEVDGFYRGADIGKVNITVSHPGQHSVEVRDFRGKIVFSIQDTGPASYPVSDVMHAGNYYVTVKAGNKTINRKISLF